MTVRMKKSRIVITAAICLVALLMIYGIFIEPYRIEVHHLYGEILPSKKALKGKIAVQLSDLHIGKPGKREDRVLALLNEIKPDFIFLTGDYISWGGDPQPALNFLSKLKARYGVWAVMGDYEYSNPRQSCVFCHQMSDGRPSGKPKVTFLRNTVVSVKLHEGKVLIGGYDMESHDFLSKEEAQNLFRSPKPDILLSHYPLIYDEFDNSREILILAGDTHGGQIPLPGWLWEIIGYENNAKYNMGWFIDGLKKMYVSRGIGTSLFPVRIMRRPEFVVFHF